MYQNGFALIASDYVKTKNEENCYHIFSAKKNILTDAVFLKSEISICRTASIKKAPLCRRFDENLSDLISWANAVLEDQICKHCSGDRIIKEAS